MTLFAASTLRAAEQQQVTDWPARLGWTAAVLVLIALLLFLMRRGWLKRARRQADVLPPLEAPAVPGSALLAPVEGTYLASTTAGDWLDRIVRHDLGVPSRATLHVTAAGMLFARDGARDVFVPAPQLRGARLDRAIAGTVTEDGGMVVVTWQHGDRLLDTGFRARAVGDHVAVVEAAGGLATAESTP